MPSDKALRLIIRQTLLHRNNARPNPVILAPKTGPKGTNVILKKGRAKRNCHRDPECSPGTDMRARAHAKKED